MVCECSTLDVVTLRRAIVRLSRVAEVRLKCVFHKLGESVMIPIGRRSIDAQTRADLNEVTARPLTLHAFADCWVRTSTSLDPQA